MKSENRIDETGQPTAVANTAGAVGRRRFVRSVSVIIPVVLTAGSRSALATVGCHSPSATASINLLHSRPDRPSEGACAGRTPGYWKNAAENHGILLARNTQFSSVYLGAYGGLSMEQVTALQGNAGYAALARHLAAAWCNLQMGWVDATVLNLDDLLAMWAGRSSGYTPVAGVTWNAAQMVDYLVTTQTL